MQKIEFRKYNNEFEFVTSPTSSFIIIKINNVSGNINQIADLVKRELKINYLSQSGVYFLRLWDGYYIGETSDLYERLSNHIKNKEVRNITFVTYKSELDRMGKEEIRDLESILIEFAEDAGLMLGSQLKNKKHEGRKASNILHLRDNEMSAEYIWNKISYLNINDILDDLKSTNSNPVPSKSIDMNLDDQKVWEPKNIIVRNIDENHELFKYVFLKKSISKGYQKERGDIFKYEYIKKCLFEYLFNGKTLGRIDKEITNDKRDRGYVAALTLAYFRIETNGEAKGILKKSLINDEKIASDLIDDFIEKNY